MADVTAAPDPPAIRLRGVAFAYPGGRQVLYGVDLDVAHGERVVVLGPNGAGKTTLMLHLNGVLRPGAGSIEIGGLPVDEANLREVRRRVGIVFQDPDDQLFMPRVRDDVAFGPANLGLDGEALDQRVAAALDAVGMGPAADLAPHHLSGGEARRVALATVLAMEPDVLVLDEPSSHLDPQARRELAQVLAGLDATVVVVTHDLPYALAAVRAGRPARRRRDRGRRAHPRPAGRHRPARRPPVGAAVRLRSDDAAGAARGRSPPSA